VGIIGKWILFKIESKREKLKTISRYVKIHDGNVFVLDDLILKDKISKGRQQLLVHSWLNFSLGVLKPKVSLGRSFNNLAILWACC
jgi:hypothetical protein